MATVASLTEQQIKVLTDFDSLLRPTIIKMNQLINEANAVAVQYSATVNPIISTLDDGQVLPTNTGLAGAVPLDKADPGYLVSYLSALTAYFAGNLNDSGHQALYVKAAGAYNLLG